MIVIQQTLVSEDILDKEFVCNLNACMGACCVEGDEGAFVDEDEKKMLKKVYPVVKEYLTKEGIDAIEKQGYWVTNDEGVLKTPLMKDGPCAYTIWEKGIALCGIEKAFLDKKVKLEEENQELASLRDWLLPMLMNGQVSVGDVEEQLGMVAEESARYVK